MTNITLPALGESVTEGTVTRWLKKVGDTVAVDEPIVEVSTDKVDTEIPSPVAGVLEEIFAQEDETIEVGAPLARIGDGGGAAPAAPAAPAAAEPVVEAPAAPAAPAVEIPVVAAPIVSEPVVVTPPVVAPPVVAPPVVPAAPVAAPVAAAPAVAPRLGVAYVSPIVRKLAHDRGVDLALVTGTGIGGRIRKEDVLAVAASAAPAAAPVSAPAVAAAPVATPAAAPATPVAPALGASELRGTRVPMTRLRKVVAERAVQSMVSTAQLTTVVEVDVTNVANLRDAIKADFQAKTGTKLTFLPFFVKAAVEALQVFPIINCTVQGDDIVYPAFENISIAVDTERGLLTPVVKDAGAKSVAALAGEIADLAARTRDNKLTPDELQGGTFTVTNTGSRGALFDTPVVFLPQSAILGLGSVVKRAVVVGDDSIAIRSMVYLALSYDHRIIDGADAARFLGTVKTRLEAGQFSAADLGY
jgi:2-oxoglutarate dehydrogenase E2 component (dihydrolipoamide succinyltransferase)